ncbi:MAG: single-stranded DNA-binding protein [Phycisphaerales bacterium]|jgi:single-strand selective monofunctional uracil DNA glycosylase|nr:single-stranded DNA-binding protein [Phycisphaerales bacterium]
MSNRLVSITRELSKGCDALLFSEPVAYVYNPLVYAWKSHKKYLEKFGDGKGRVLLIGMNPGPWGMAQTGVPFGEVNAVRDFLDIEETVQKPNPEHPKREVLGFQCPRSEVSGRRVWEWAKQRFVTPESFFNEFFVLNYCPLCFMEDGGKNRTPDKLRPEERDAVFDICDVALTKFVKELEPSKIVGIGGFAKKRAMKTLNRDDIETILHPSPASPIANRGWAPQIEKQFEAMGVLIPQIN